MDDRRFDQLARSCSAVGTRRGLARLLATLPVVAGFLALSDAESHAAGRRKRRKKAHKHGKGKHKDNRKGKRKGKQKQKEKPCRPQSPAETCADRCGTVKNHCRKAVDCGSCACDPPCSACRTCQHEPGAPGVCVPAHAGEACGQPGQVCQADGRCTCVATSCPACTACQGATCAPLADGTVCPGNNVCCGGACVDVTTDVRNCGACGERCTALANATATCTAGSCGFTCTMGFADCNDDPRDGCETALTTDPLNCGACGHACPLHETCVTGGCLCSGFSGSVAPYTCCPGGERAICGTRVTAPVVPDACAVTEGACPAGYTLCPGLPCNACCPANATCDPQGFCRQT